VEIASEDATAVITEDDADLAAVFVHGQGHRVRRVGAVACDLLGAALHVRTATRRCTGAGAGAGQAPQHLQRAQRGKRLVRPFAFTRAFGFGGTLVVRRRRQERDREHPHATRRSTHLGRRRAPPQHRAGGQRVHRVRRGRVQLTPRVPATVAPAVAPLVVLGALGGVPDEPLPLRCIVVACHLRRDHVPRDRHADSHHCLVPLAIASVEVEVEVGGELCAEASQQGRQQHQCGGI